MSYQNKRRHARSRDWLYWGDCVSAPKIHIIKAMVFPVVMCGFESWTIKKVECWRNDTFKFWCCRRLLRVPWTARRSNQSILKEINPEYSLEGLMLKLKLQHFGHLIWRPNSLEKTLMLRKTEGGKRRGRQKMRCLDGITDGHEFEQAPGVGDGQGRLCCCPWSLRVGHNLLTEYSKCKADSFFFFFFCTTRHLGSLCPNQIEPVAPPVES